MSQFTQEQAAILADAAQYVQDEMRHDSTGHDWTHAERVVRLARTIAAEEQADPFRCELAALLHDIADAKLNPSEAIGLAKVRRWLESRSVPADDAEAVLEIISTLSFKGGNSPAMKTVEGKVVQDADRLDAIGAIGIARVFVYSGAKGRPIHDPSLAPRTSMTEAEYRSGRDTAINHFHEKLLKLKDRMNTDYGRRLAEGRHQVMLRYLAEFDAEWNGER